MGTTLTQWCEVHDSAVVNERHSGAELDWWNDHYGAGRDNENRQLCEKSMRTETPADGYPCSVVDAVVTWEG